MEARIYGIIDKDNVLIDVSRTERGCKRYATLNGFKTVGYRVGYNAFVLATKNGKKWQSYKENN